MKILWHNCPPSDKISILFSICFQEILTFFLFCLSTTSPRFLEVVFFITSAYFVSKLFLYFPNTKEQKSGTGIY